MDGSQQIDHEDHEAVTADIRADTCPTPVGDRARFIASMHALAEWFREHPEVPVPESVLLRHHIHYGTYAERCAQVDRFARAQDIDAMTVATGTHYAALPVMTRHAYGADVDMTVQTHGDRPL